MKIDIVSSSYLTPTECDEMYSVFARYYDNINYFRFKTDLAGKNWIILLRNIDQCIVGFSTLEIYEYSSSAGPVAIIYSGDTIVDRAYRLNGGLAGAFGHLLVRMIQKHRSVPLYWSLASKGARTYRVLPVFFNTFYPVFDKNTPESTKALMDEIALEKFGNDYSPHTQIVSHHGQRDWLCASEHDPSHLERDDPHIRFFLEKNPGYARGDELACLAEVSEGNLNARARRVITHTKVQWRE